MPCRSLAIVLEPMAHDGSLSKTCLVRFGSNKYSVMASAVGRPVEIRAYAERLEIRQGEPCRAIGPSDNGEPRCRRARARLRSRQPPCRRLPARDLNAGRSHRAAAPTGGAALPGRASPEANSPARRNEPTSSSWRAGRRGRPRRRSALEGGSTTQSRWRPSSSPFQVQGLATQTFSEDRR